MSLDSNITMVEAMRLTRAGRLTEATEVLQRGLVSAGTAAADESTVAQPFGDLGHLPRPIPNSRPVRRREAPLMPRPPAGVWLRISRPRRPACQTSLARLGGPEAHDRLAVAQRRGLLARQWVRSATSLTPVAPGPAATTSTFRPATPMNPFRLWSCSMAASRAGRTSRPARG